MLLYYKLYSKAKKKSIRNYQKIFIKLFCRSNYYLCNLTHGTAGARMNRIHRLIFAFFCNTEPSAVLKARLPEGNALKRINIFDALQRNVPQDTFPLKLLLLFNSIFFGQCFLILSFKLPCEYLIPFENKQQYCCCRHTHKCLTAI